MFRRKVEPKDNRRFPRFMSDAIRFEMDGRELPVVDISATGIQVRGAPNWIARGQGINFRLLVPIRKETATIPASGRVVRRQGDTLSLAYGSPHPDWTRLLTQFLSRHP